MAQASICIPAHNAERTVGACLDALAAQTCGDYEVICVDDGSVDGTAELLRARAAVDERIRVISQACQGVSAARNAALQAAAGEYALFVDADDVVEPELLAHALERATATGAEMTIFGFWEWHAESGALVEREMCEEPQLQGRAFSLADLQSISTTLLTPNVWRVLFKRSFLAEHGLAFHEDLRTSEDLAFLYEALACAPRIALLNERLYRYRRDGGATLTRTDRTGDGLAALRYIAACQDGAYLRDEVLLRHYVNLVLDTLRYDLGTAAAASEYACTYASLQEEWLPLVAAHEELVHPMLRGFYDAVSASDAVGFLFGAYAQARSEAEVLRSENAALRDEAQAARREAGEAREAVGRSLTSRMKGRLRRTLGR